MIFFENKKFYIAGGSSGIGLEAARRLSTFGASVSIFGRDQAKLNTAHNAVEKEKNSENQKVYSLSVDVTDHKEVENKMNMAVKESGVPDILINSAGVGHADYFENSSYDSFNKVILANLYGSRNTIAALLPLMKKEGGQIVNVSSMLGLIGIFGYTAYSASKFGLVGFSECLRSELKRYNIAVSVYCPPEVDTPMTDYMLTISPPETRALVKLTGLMSVEKSAMALLTRIAKKRFLIVPGFLSKWTYFNKCLNPSLTQVVADIIVKLAIRRSKS